MCCSASANLKQKSKAKIYFERATVPECNSVKCNTVLKYNSAKVHITLSVSSWHTKIYLLPWLGCLSMSYYINQLYFRLQIKGRWGFRLNFLSQVKIFVHSLFPNRALISVLMLAATDVTARILCLPPYAAAWLEPMSVELHHTWTFEGRSTDWATAPRPLLGYFWLIC